MLYGILISNNTGYLSKVNLQKNQIINLPMNSKLLLSFFLSFHLSLLIYSQNVHYSYDNSGNRIARYIISKEIKQLQLDSLNETIAINQQEILDLCNINIFPNPTNNWIIIRCTNQESLVLKAMLFSAQGSLKKTVTIESDEVTINLHDLDVGIYFLKICNQDMVLETWKIIKL